MADSVRLIHGVTIGEFFAGEDAPDEQAGILNTIVRVRQVADSRLRNGSCFAANPNRIGFLNVFYRNVATNWN